MVHWSWIVKSIPKCAANGLRSPSAIMSSIRQNRQVMQKYTAKIQRRRCSVVVFRRLLECLPLDRIMSMNDQNCPFAPRQFNEFACAGTYTCFIHIERSQSTPLRIKIGCTDNSINGQQDRTSLWQMHQDRLMTRDMSTRFN